MTDAVALKDIETPPGGGGLLLGPTLPRLAAWIGVRLLAKPLRLGGRVIAARHAHVTEVLNRDLDFRIGPVNAERINEVNGPFVLGMDRGDRLTTERRALYVALSAMDFRARAAEAGQRADALIAAAGGGSLDVVGGFARPVAAGAAQRLFGVSGPDEVTFQEVARAIFAHTFLNLGGDKTIEARAVKASVLMRAWLADEIARRRAAGDTGDDLMGALMRELPGDDDAVRRLLGGMLVGAVDTTASAVAKIVYVMGRDRRLYAAARRDLGDPARLLGWCREALRRWPHNPILLRQAAVDTELDGVAVPAKTQVFVWTQAAMLDAAAFPSPAALQPDRAAGPYLHFGGGLHPCAGRALNDLQVPMLVGKLLGRGVAKVGAVSWAGPFPAHLTVQLEGAPMTQALVTVAAPIAVGRIPDALALIEALGNPANPALAEALNRLDGDDGVHFASLHAIAPTNADSPTGHLVLEFSADGTEDEALARVVDRIGADLTAIFALASDRGDGELAAYFTPRKLELGVGWMGRTGLAFAGTPGMSVGRIHREAALAAHLAPKLEAQKGGLTALQRLGQIRDDVRANPEFAWALETPTALPVAPNPATLSLILGVAVNFAATYLWPLLIPYFIVLGFGVERNWAPFMALFAGSAAAPLKAWMVLKALWSALLWALAAACAFAVPVLGFLAWLYLDLRAKEATDWLDERAPQRTVLHGILARENVYAQNHMVSVTTRKPGLTRRLTARLAFWLIGQLAVRQFKPGHLGDIGTIHFARWVMLPNGRDFVFFSNYGGSWESYLEDFITKAHNGLTAVWSNTVGFPKSENLFGKGATDGERFKRYARRSMLPTPFWHSSYPTLTTDNIRANAAIRCGLAAAMTDEEAKAWLALFGSAQRPAAKLESDQIQSLVFGGLGFKPYGEVLLVDLGDDRAAARAWLGALRPHVAFDDGRRLQDDAILTLALGPGALAKAGLPPDALETFPPAFLDGMTGPGRDRILGDDQSDAAWWWGAERGPDAAVLVYGHTAAAATTLANKVRDLVQTHGHAVTAAISLNPVPKSPHEPFEFLDGVSQPVIRGTYRGLRTPDPIHLVEPGEFILGYPDNRGNLPPGPTLKALDDPDNRLPIHLDDAGTFATPEADAPREVGRNGSFLVIRQLEQDHKAFWDYCEAEAAALKDRLPAPYVITKEFIGAKLVGRWPNGSSLVRNPYQPFGANKLEERDTQRPESHPSGHAAVPLTAAPAAIAPAAPTPVKTIAAGSDHESLKTGAPKATRDLPDHGDNDFLFGAEDPQGLRCPYGAHIRRANPRDSLSPGSQDQVDISNRHRIIRVGRSYKPTGDQKPGLLFMCLNGDLERQFEFVQQTWLGSETFHGLSGERDPLAGNPSGCPIGFTIPTRDGPIRLSPLSRFVTPRGGGYFFLPGKTLLAFLSD